MDTNEAVSNALTMSDFKFDNDASQTREQAVTGLIAELGEQGFVIVPASTQDAILALPLGGQPSLFEYSPADFAERIAMLKAEVTYGQRCVMMRAHVTDYHANKMLGLFPVCTNCTSVAKVTVPVPFKVGSEGRS